MCHVVNKLLPKYNPVYKYDNFSNKIADTFQTLEIRMFLKPLLHDGRYLCQLIKVISQTTLMYSLNIKCK